MAEQTAPTPATLSTQDGSETYTFTIAPEAVQYEYSADFSRLPVLNTSQPLVKYRFSDSRISLPILRFWNDGNISDISAYLDRLTGWTKPQNGFDSPAKLKFSWGSLQLPSVYLARFSYTVTQWRSGKPTQATGAIELQLAPDSPEPLEDPEATLLSAREQEEYTAKVQEALKDSTLATSLGTTPEAKIEVSETGEVTADGNAIGSLADILGADNVRPGLSNLGSEDTTET